MSWTTPEDLIVQVERLWTSGRLLACAPTLGAGGEHGGERLAFPLQLRLRRPGPRDLGDRFEDVREWVRALDEGLQGARRVGYVIEWEEVNTRELGRNRLPAGVRVASRGDALAIIGKTAEAIQFDSVVEQTLAHFPTLQDWLGRRALVALEHFDDWSRILDCLAWFRDHPRSSLYMRQIDVAGVDTKFIEARKSLLAELLEIMLPSTAVEQDATGVKAFEARYGLRTKPALIRFRILDERMGIAGLTDLTVPAEQLTRLALDIQRVFIVENEITGLAFPPVAGSIVVLGLGHAVSLLSAATWLGQCEVHYWSDIDTDGFAMLDRLRTNVPHARSLLMDRDTLLAHRQMWSTEDAPLSTRLDRLATAEAELYADLRFNRLGRSVRLEQERISFSWLLARIREVVAGAH